MAHGTFRLLPIRNTVPGTILLTRDGPPGLAQSKDATCSQTGSHNWQSCRFTGSTKLLLPASSFHLLPSLHLHVLNSPRDRRYADPQKHEALHLPCASFTFVLYCHNNDQFTADQVLPRLTLSSRLLLLAPDSALY